MALEATAKEAKYGDDIIAFRAQLLSAQNTISSVKNNILAMRTAVIAEYGNPSDQLTEVNAFSSGALTDLKAFVASL